MDGPGPGACFAQHWSAARNSASMSSTHRQQQFLVGVQGSRVAYFPGRLAASAANLMSALLREVPWVQRNVTVMGRSVPQPRLICYMADEGLQYTYSGLTLQVGNRAGSLLPCHQAVIAWLTAAVQSSISASVCLWWVVHADDEVPCGWLWLPCHHKRACSPRPGCQQCSM